MAVFGRDAVFAFEKILDESAAVLRRIVVAISRVPAFVALFGLTAFQLLEALLLLDLAVGLVVIGKQRIPPLLLLSSHLAAVRCLAKLVDGSENRRSRLA